MRLRSGRIISTTSASNENVNLRKYFDYDSDSDYKESESNCSDLDYDIDDIDEYDMDDYDIDEYENESDNNYVEAKPIEAKPKPSLLLRPYQVNVMNRINTFKEIKSKFFGSNSYYIELARAITELYGSMNIYFEDWIDDMYNDIDYSDSAYKVLTIANDKARSFIVSLMHELTTSKNALYNKQENIKIIHAALNEMREFIHRVEEHILAEDTNKY